MKDLREVQVRDLPCLGQAKPYWPWIVDDQAELAPDNSYEGLPSFSVLVPSYQQGKFLEENLRSIILQAYPKVDLIIIDGGSQDESQSLLEAYSPWISYWQSRPDKGTWDALNQGLHHMQGEYWVVVNSDDMLLSGTLWKAARHILEEQKGKGEVHWLSAGVDLIDADSRCRKKSYPEQPQQAVGGLYFMNYCYIYHAATFLSKELFERVGLFPATHIMDYAYWLRAEQMGFSPTLFKERWAAFRIHSSSKTSGMGEIYRQVEAMQKKIANEEADKAQRREMKWHINQRAPLVAKTRLLELLFLKRYAAALGLCLKLGIKKPGYVGKRWFWGVLKRFVFPVHRQEFDPFHWEFFEDNQ